MKPRIKTNVYPRKLKVTYEISFGPTVNPYWLTLIHKLINFPTYFKNILKIIHLFKHFMIMLSKIEIIDKFKLDIFMSFVIICTKLVEEPLPSRLSVASALLKITSS